MKKFFVTAVIICMMVCSVPGVGAASAENCAPLLKALGIMVGDESGNLHLDNYVSRAEFAKMAVAASEYHNMVATNVRTSSYKDVPASHWAAPYIKTGVDVGFCSGYYDSTFRPDNTVLYEEAVTILLKVLGYTNEDLGSSWPYSQIGLAENTGISDGVDVSAGQPLTRRTVAELIYNTLNTKMKNGSGKLLNVFDTAVMENSVIISVKNDKKDVYTSAGSYKADVDFSQYIGCEGDLYIEDGNRAIAFAPDGGGMNAEKHIVYSVLGNSVVTYRNGGMQTLNIPLNTSVFDDSMTTTYSAVSPYIEMGDVMYVSRSGNNIDFVIFEDGDTEGPFTVNGIYGTGNYPGAKIYRNGESALASDLQHNDIYYYVPELNAVMSYSNKVTGVYEKAEPNKDAPVSVTVSGVSYKIESGTAFGKLATGGSFSYGDTVTLLLGKNNEIADVAEHGYETSSVYGFLFDTGKKEYTTGTLEKYTGFFIKVVTPDGKVNEYVADKDYSDFKNSVKKITFSNGIARAGTFSATYDISGRFDWNSKKIGTIQLSSDLKVIDVEDDGRYVQVLPGRLNGVKLSYDNILYAEKNSKGQVERLILHNVTGDMYSYGIILSAQNSGSGAGIMGSYTYDIGGVTSSFISSGVSYNVMTGQAAKIGFSKTGVCDLLTGIDKLDGIITDVSHTSLKAGNTVYPISNRVSVYKKGINHNYTLIPISDVINGNNSITAFCDKDPESGGCVRIIVAE